MLNLLIAIISDTFSKISQNDNEISYKEKAILVAGMQDTLKYCLKAKIDHNERLFVAKVISSEDLMKEDFGDKIEDLREEMGEMNQKIEDLSHKQQDIKSEIVSHIDKQFEMLSFALSQKMDEKVHGEKTTSLNDYLREH